MTRDLVTVQEMLPQPPGFDIVTPLASRALFGRPRFAPDHPALAHVPFLFWLADMLRPSAFVTLGGGDGIAHFALAQATDKFDLDCRGYGFGPWPGGVVPAALAAHNAAAYPDLSQLSALDPAAAMARFPQGAVDLLLLRLEDEDEATPGADQRNSALCEACEQGWLARLSDRGVLVLQGLAAVPRQGAVADFLARLGHAHPTFRLEGGEGLMLALIGKHPPERLAQLCRLGLGTPGYGAVTQIFGRLGNAVRIEATLQAETARAERLAARAEAAEARLVEMQPPPDDAPAGMVAALQAMVADLQDRLAARETALASAQAETATAPEDHGLAKELTARIATLQTERAELDVMLEGLRKERERLGGLLEELRADAKAKADEAAAALEAALAEAGTLAARVSTLEAERAAAVLRQDDLLRQSRILAAERDVLEADLGLAKAEVAELSRRLADQMAAATDRESALLAEAEARKAALEADIRVLTAGMAADRTQAEAARHALEAERDAARAAAVAEAATLTERLAQAEADHAAALAAAAARIAALSAERDAAEQGRIRAQEELSGQQILLRDRLADLQALRSAAATDRKTIESLRAERKRAEAQIRAMHETVERILGSTSWRLTSPLRRMVETLRRSPKPKA